MTFLLEHNTRETKDPRPTRTTRTNDNRNKRVSSIFDQTLPRGISRVSQSGKIENQGMIRQLACDGDLI